MGDYFAGLRSSCCQHGIIRGRHCVCLTLLCFQKKPNKKIQENKYKDYYEYILPPNFNMTHKMSKQTNKQKKKKKKDEASEDKG
jgi:hypothetical protein